MTEAEAITQMSKARAQLLLSHPFFATGALHLTIQTADFVPIAATDGQFIYVNPNGIANYSMDDIKGLWAEEVGHNYLDHAARRGDRDPTLWNKACDEAVLNILKENGFSIPPECCCHPQYANKSAEEIYKLMPKDGGGSGGGGNGPCPPGGLPGSGKPGQQNHPGNGKHPGLPQPGATRGAVMDSPPDKSKQISDGWRIALQQAIHAARSCGQMPAGIDQLVEITKGPRASWFDRLKRFVAATVVADYTWSRPSRRTASLGIYLPSTTKEGTGHIDVAIDCSGSISDRELQEFGSKFAALHEELKPELIRAIYFDAIVQNVREFGPEDQVTFDVKGRGGTDVRTAFDWIAKSGRVPKCLVILTDLETPFPEPPSYPVLWVTVNQHTAPFGDVCYMEVN